MDARRFPTEPGWRVGKCRNERLAGLAPSGLALFFGSVSFGPAKEMNPLAVRRVEAFDFAFLPESNAKTWIKRFRPLSRPSSFLLVDAKRNGTKEKRLPDTSEARGFECAGIFRLGILPRSENAAHPWAAPSGSASRAKRLVPCHSNRNSSRATTTAKTRSTSTS
ncbi:hypothetical protein [Luteimonas terrae]|uniref:Uncharacterized protein n=1 Tax=Luteimonas terrae TaxID=1530191 RepID=A0ABU1XW70_9GAMM|nr:hypothetical protein [Luteimonas terrae]MDR7193007.1 hypothetical protein [Luteimonas terrae]